MPIGEASAGFGSLFARAPEDEAVRAPFDLRRPRYTARISIVCILKVFR